MDSKVKTEERGFIRDMQNGALLNTDNEGLRVHKARRADRQVRDQLAARVEYLEQLVLTLIKAQSE